MEDRVLRSFPAELHDRSCGLLVSDRCYHGHRLLARQEEMRRRSKPVPQARQVSLQLWDQLARCCSALDVSCTELTWV
jgi:hypothetical protein